MCCGASPSVVLRQLALVEVVEVGMLHRHAARNPLVRLQRHSARQQVQPVLVQVLRVLRQGQTLPLGEGGLEVRQLQRCGPVALIRGALDLEDFEYLVDFRVAREKRLSLSHLSKDAADRPNVDRSGILLLAEEDLGSSVPKGHNLVSVGLDRQAEGARQTEICEFDVAVLID